MTTTSIQFIQNPPFSVDFRQYSKNPPTPTISLTSRVKSIVTAPFLLIKAVFVSLAQAAYTTLSYSGASFKHIVLGYYGSLRLWRPTLDVCLIVFKIVVWGAAVSWCFVTTTVRLLHQQTQDDTKAHSFLADFAGDEMDVSHIVTQDLSIDVSEIPADVTVNHLLKIFDEINFINPHQPGYMAPASRQEGATTYTVPELRESLRKFVNDVNQRVAFLGTPPSYDTPRLFAFYQQLENAVRFSIQKSNQDLIDFKKENGENFVSTKYKNLLEDRARIALNLAIAGKHCGARYMGEAMEIYDAAKEEATVRGTLQDTLIEILAAKRKEIARKHIQAHLGFDTHSYNNYMSNLGKILAIPGTEDVIEHLSSRLDRSRFLKLFFQDYTVDCIQETVQTKIKQSQTLREKIIDWLKTQPKDWQPEGILPLDELVSQINPVLGENLVAEDFLVRVHLLNLRELIGKLDQQEIPSHENWDEFLVELFNSNKPWFNAKYPKPLDQARAKKAMKDLFSDQQLGKDLIAKTKEAIAGNRELDIELFIPRLLVLQKIPKLIKIAGLNIDTATRVVEGKKDLRQALEEQRSQLQSNEFIGSLQLEEIEQKGLSPKLLEWVLVSQKILLTQAE